MLHRFIDTIVLVDRTVQIPEHSFDNKYQLSEFMIQFTKPEISDAVRRTVLFHLSRILTELLLYCLVGLGAHPSPHFSSAAP